MNVRSLSKPQLLSLLSAARQRRERDWLLLLVMFHHALRVSEAIQLTRDNFDGGFLTVERLKGSLKTTQALVEHPEPLLNERPAVFDYLANLHGNQRLFPITRQRVFQLVREHGAAAGIPKHLLFTHVMKHSICAQTIHAAGIENVRQRAGHKSISSTGAYLKVTDQDADEAIARALSD